MTDRLALPAAYADWTPRHVEQVRADLSTALDAHHRAALAVSVGADGGCGGATTADALADEARECVEAAQRVALCCARLVGQARAWGHTMAANSYQAGFERGRADGLAGEPHRQPRKEPWTAARDMGYLAYFGGYAAGFKAGQSEREAEEAIRP